MFLLLIRWYRDRGARKAKRRRRKLNNYIYAQNKRKLSPDDRLRREFICAAFRDKYGRDIDVYGDCRHVPFKEPPLPAAGPHDTPSALGWDYKDNVGETNGALDESMNRVFQLHEIYEQKDFTMQL